MYKTPGSLKRWLLLIFLLAFVLLWTDDNAAGPLLGHAHRTELWIVVGTLVAGAIRGGGRIPRPAPC